MPIRPWIILASLALARIAFGYQFQSIATVGTALVDRFALSYARLGSLIGIYNLFGVFAALPLGLLGRRFGDRWVLGAGLALMTGGTCFGAWADTISGIAAGRAAAGFGAVAMIVLQGKVIADWFSGARFMIGISVSVCSFPIGMGLAQIAVPPILAQGGLHAALLSGALPAGMALLLFLGSYRRSPHAVPPTRSFTLPSARECLLLLIAGGAWTVYTAGFSAYAAYLPSSLSLRGYGMGLIAVVMTVATWGNVPGTLAGGDLAARFGGFRIFMIGSLALSIGMAGSALTGWPVAWAALLGVVGSIQPGVTMAIGTLSARPENRAVGMGLFYTIYYLGGTFAPALCGIAADYTGRPEGALLAASALAAVAIPLFMLHRALASHGTMLVRA
ncbi:MAG TPA: MFS transporter [Rhodopila sp.]|jgi:MFS family permease|nr:MFS transporter [Rhodopila sp.]